MAHSPSAHMARHGRTETTSGANPAATSQSHPNTSPVPIARIAVQSKAERPRGNHRGRKNLGSAEGAAIISVSFMSFPRGFRKRAKRRLSLLHLRRVLAGDLAHLLHHLRPHLELEFFISRRQLRHHPAPHHSASHTLAAHHALALMHHSHHLLHSLHPLRAGLLARALLRLGSARLAFAISGEARHAPAEGDSHYHGRNDFAIHVCLLSFRKLSRSATTSRHARCRSRCVRRRRKGAGAPCDRSNKLPRCDRSYSCRKHSAAGPRKRLCTPPRPWRSLQYRHKAPETADQKPAHTVRAPWGYRARDPP